MSETIGQKPIKVGDIFTIGNKDAPEWCGGQWIVTKILESSIECESHPDRNRRGTIEIPDKGE